MHLLNFSLNELKNQLLLLNEKPFRSEQIFEWVYKKNATGFDGMKNLGKELIEKLKKNFAFPVLTLDEPSIFNDEETTKYSFKLEDGYFIESVLIRSKERKTICVSSQVGCKAGCPFCASGKLGFVRDLSPAEILEQIIYVMSIEKNITNIVFMGMGEPLNNFQNVLFAIKMINNPEGLKFSSRRISLSTVGIPAQIEALAKQNLELNLVVSLHAPNQQLREKLIPYAKLYPLDEIMRSLENYFTITKRDIALEYILIDGVNDNLDCAKELFLLVKKRHMSINLIPYNSIDGVEFKRSSNDKINAFKSYLESKGAVVSQRYTKGKNIAAACGQLALKKSANNFLKK